MRLKTYRRPAALSLFAAALLLAACTNAGSGSPGASAGSALTLTVSHTAVGDALAGPNGMTLYILTKDTDGTSTCTTGPCAATWPALKGDGSAVQAGSGISGTWGTATWADGTKQVTHNGQPVYYYTGDSAAGDSNGQGANGVWFIAPVGSSATTASQPAANATASATPAGPNY
ncbi:MAG: COG4315 family predicted lipoprotein [Candidatus Limnocylindria bacterium]